MKPIIKSVITDPTHTVAIDWDAIHAQLKDNKNALTQDYSQDPADIQSILHARAVLLAKETSPSHEPVDSIEVIEFEMGAEYYAVESSFIQEVYSLNDLTPLPCVPPYVVGIINIRGQIISVIDLRIVFGLVATGFTDFHQVILLSSEFMSFGILAEKVSGTRVVDLSKLQISMPTLTGSQNAYLKGITTEQIVILDAKKLLADLGLVVNEQVGTAF